MTDSPEVTPVIEVNTCNDYMLSYAQNLPNHSMSLKGRGAYISQIVSTGPVFRTRQEIYRYAAWLVHMAPMLPDATPEESSHDFKTVSDAIANS